MTEDADMDRRFVLRVLASLLPAAACTVAPATRPPSPALLSLGPPASVVELGRRYLRAFPEEGNRDELRRRLGLADPDEPEHARIARIDAAVLADIDAGQTFEVAGWLLSRTEGRVYALASLQ